MGTKVKDLSVEELQTLISKTVRESIEDLMEDIIALSSKKYKLSIEEARADYKENRVKGFEEIFEV